MGYSASPPPSRVLSPSSSVTSPSLRALELEQGPVSGTALERTNTISTLGGFEFEHALLPLSLSGEEQQPTEHKHVGLLQGMALVVGMQVGSGIFASPGVVVDSVGSVGASLIVWLVSGLLAWTGATSFAELGCAIPLSGGAQAYLAYSFGPLLSYLFTWSAVTTLKPGSAAIIALIFGEYVNRMIYQAVTGSTEAVVPQWTFKVTACLAVLFVTALNLISAKAGTHSAVVLTAIKIGSLVFVGVLGLLYLIRNGPGESFAKGAVFKGSSTNPGDYAIALYSGLWAFDGWDQCSFVGGEMTNPNRDLPRALHSSMTIVLILFLSANVSYFIVLPPSVVASSNTVALDFGRATIGKLGGLVFSTLVAISCFGALNGGCYTTSRLIYAAARDHFLPSMFARLDPKRRTPDLALTLNAALTVFFIVFGGGFRKLVNFFSVTSWTWYLVTVVGLLYLRIKEPHLERPYKAWITTPVMFCMVRVRTTSLSQIALFLLLMPIFAAPWEGLAAFLFMAAGVPVYYLTARSRSRQARGYSRVDGEEDAGGVGATLRDAYASFMDDVAHLLPERWAARLGPTAPRDREEQQGMLQRVEMVEL
ncbi:hypothetical protein CspeluHIS016_0604220 [Cutaneotrichosporon spelunceum]|uniref:Amino acid transporter n=1 Tax=Cutaneotrichosporon spelunceum TaxID=1672016 RepID=A0AAD3TY02_9TREE|nr:hypothetical protein CspeluHIS016_0604220 [Cutaneotrichosporon spelunceum]